jgi:hypothetical protein
MSSVYPHRRSVRMEAPSLEDQLPPFPRIPSESNASDPRSIFLCIYSSSFTKSSLKNSLLKLNFHFVLVTLLPRDVLCAILHTKTRSRPILYPILYIHAHIYIHDKRISIYHFASHTHSPPFVNLYEVGMLI